MRATQILEYWVFGYCAKLVTCSVDPWLMTAECWKHLSL